MVFDKNQWNHYGNHVSISNNTIIMMLSLLYKVLKNALLGLTPVLYRCIIEPFTVRFIGSSNRGIIHMYYDSQKEYIINLTGSIIITSLEHYNR